MKTHTYTATITWTGNTGRGTSDYRAYERAHDISVAGKPTIPGSSDPSFRGDRARYNPEELFVASLSTCHMLWYLHLASDAGIIVTDYVDAPLGTMNENADGSGEFTDVLLRPRVTVRAGADRGAESELHHRANALCFLARSVKFAVRCEATLEIEAP